MEVREPDARYLAQRNRTELGDLPVDWRVVPIGELQPFITSGSRGWATYYSESGSTFLRITNLSRECIYPSLNDLRYVAIPPGDSEGIRTALEAGDILISITADIGIVGLVTPAIELPAYVNQHIALVRIADEQADAGYLAYFLAGAASQRRFKAMTDAGAKAGMNLTGVRQVLAAFPPTGAEQQAIAKALSDADALIESLSLLLAKKRQIKQGAMQELLIGKKRLPGHSGPWVTRAVAEIADCLDNLRVPLNDSARAAMKGEYPYCGANGVLDYIDRYCIDDTVVLIAEDGGYFDEYLSRPIAYRMSGKFWVNNHAHVLRAKLGFDNDFLFYALVHKNVLAYLASGTRAKLNRGELDKIGVLAPLDQTEQRAIAQVLADVDAEMEAIEARLVKARDVKQAMMHALLTGRIRLVQPASNIIPLPLKPAAAHPPPPQPAHNWQINEAVVIGVLAQRFGNEKFPLPRKRRVKLMYLLHRHAEGRAEGYLKKAAGPYDPNTKYKGPEAIALKNGYVRAVHNGTYEGFVGGDKSDQAQRYFDQWYGMPSLDWLERFHYRKTDDLELLATVDMAMVDLAAAGQPANLVGVKRVIAAHPEWVPKLSRELFSDDRIAGAIAECQVLFGG